MKEHLLKDSFRTRHAAQAKAEEIHRTKKLTHAQVINIGGSYKVQITPLKTITL